MSVRCRVRGGYREPDGGQTEKEQEILVSNIGYTYARDDNWTKLDKIFPSLGGYVG